VERSIRSLRNESEACLTSASPQAPKPYLLLAALDS